MSDDNVVSQCESIFIVGIKYVNSLNALEHENKISNYIGLFYNIGFRASPTVYCCDKTITIDC